ncbi:hypothetical protein [Nostoc linckia]|uniref:hypothetical protein n=1 Tax=Nostoc linckia TaxID=92942 RepID=UPI00117E502D|nr:hypothetical protein [Nostoc linckia]
MGIRYWAVCPAPGANRASSTDGGEIDVIVCAHSKLSRCLWVGDLQFYSAGGGCIPEGEVLFSGRVRCDRGEDDCCCFGFAIWEILLAGEFGSNHWFYSCNWWWENLGKADQAANLSRHVVLTREKIE